MLPMKWAPSAAARIAAICLGTALPACSLFTAHTTFTSTMNYPRSSAPPSEIQMIFRGNAPARDFIRVSQLNTGRSDYQSNEDLFQAIRREAARAGLDGVVDLQCVPGYSYAYQCVGTGFVYR
ncbi:hypothetical protein [Plastoroseomonas hellenica]|uniref:hypothetical protein n=1 Tax=Plastoroseomonas hellenica TaxID=2687306 RepID=UPI001BA43C04|nr:hypothetical protein [Plastoroseomonas hellenica]MBR0644442.1 hypothetical protein [Plastoroseomonas hellenica]